MASADSRREGKGNYTGTLGVYVDAQDVHSLRLSRTGLVVVDMIYGSTHPEYGYLKMYRQMGLTDACEYYLRRLASKVVPNIKSLQLGFRESGLPVIFTTNASEEEDYADLVPRTRLQMVAWKEQGFDQPFMRVWEPGARVLEELAPSAGERVINKTRTSAFNGSNIDDHLREMGLELLVFVGVGTNYCVQHTLIDAYDFGYECILIEDATATLTKDVQQVAIESMSVFAKITTTAAVLAELKSLGHVEAG